MDLELIKYIGYGLVAVVMYFFKRNISEMDRRLEKTEEELQHIRMNYLQKEDFKDFKAELRLMFSELQTDIRSLRKVTENL